MVKSRAPALRAAIVLIINFSSEMSLTSLTSSASATSPPHPYVRGPKRAPDPELTPLLHVPIIKFGADSSGGNRVWRQNRTQSSRRDRERCVTTWEESKAPPVN